MQIVILCPYCLSPIQEGTTVCSACREDTTRDSRFEWSVQKYDDAKRKPCSACGASILELAVICPQCRHRQ
jgi:hypothetical protein